VPLDAPVTKFGNAAPSDGQEFSIAGAMLGTAKAVTSPLCGSFSPGQFQQLSDSDQISDPAFENFHCGVQIGDPDVEGGSDAPRTVTMQWRYVPDPAKASVLDGFEALPASLLDAALATGAGARSAVKNTGLAKYATPGMTSVVSTSSVAFVITSTQDLSVRADISPAAGTTSYQAKAALASYLAAHPEEAGGLQVMPLYEVTA
jgi:hypothetical protein